MKQNISSVDKGNALENSFYDYLKEQMGHDKLIFGIYASEHCRLYQKKKYYCNERSHEIEFDIVIEIYREGAINPHLRLIFECKNYAGSVPESEISSFSDKLSRIAKHGAKGVMVITSQLQSGALSLAKSRKIGVIKYDAEGLEYVLERRNIVERNTLSNQITNSNRYTQSLKFSSYFDGLYFDNFQNFVQSVLDISNIKDTSKQKSIPFLSHLDIERKVALVLRTINYREGVVDLGQICNEVYVTLDYSDEELSNSSGCEILGKADFQKRQIIIFNNHPTEERKRFTIAHEIGHFCLDHDKYMHSESVIEKDLIEQESTNSLSGLEYQANYFASCLLLPERHFLEVIKIFRNELDIRDKGHGYIYVDDQPCNIKSYIDLTQSVGQYFKVSNKVVEIRLEKLGLITDNRTKTNINMYLPKYKLPLFHEIL